ncbi:hypothetical protein KKR91_07920 [Arthrobacter jiangjiafuii]|uniref:Uncharacterized protein n=1 Tax=Arthrobacter jiangjiafuii TaxID=2817475 RepID=A0A975M805_9MICC|nr:hypothetical protein [Arthrobacter jiangjiafuii]MBP3042931.1 hypothetical protein [Arthrobacter jiangjiafuii]QWC11460.1 hypothetical protein KKR91_07920 [Arthrobacter jiangjiafuii]
MTDYVEVPLLSHDSRGRFEYGVAGAMKAGFESAAAQLDEQGGSRTSIVSAAKEDFTGRFSEIFQDNATTAAYDAKALADALRDVAGFVGTMIEAGRKEDERRRQNNEWVWRHNNRTWLEEIGDWFGGEEPRPTDQREPAPSFPQATAASGPRQTQPGAGGNGPIDSAFKVRFPAGTAVYEGAVAPQTAADGRIYPGGTPQVHIKESWKKGEVIDTWRLE